MVRTRRHRKVRKHNRTHKLIRIHHRLTDYPKRLILLRGGHPILTITASNRQFNIIAFADVTDYTHITFSMGSNKLRQLGYQDSLVSRHGLYLLGYFFGKTFRAQNASEDEFVINFGMLRAPKYGRLYALVRGIYDAGFPIRASSDNFPSDVLLSQGQPELQKLITDFKEKIDGQSESLTDSTSTPGDYKFPELGEESEADVLENDTEEDDETDPDSKDIEVEAKYD